MSASGTRAPVAARRCFNHAQREAVARCPSCQRFYCRECVVEHAGRMTCQACLAASANAEVRDRSSFGQSLAGACLLAASAAATWGVFYAVVKTASALPNAFHDNPADYFLEDEGEDGR